MKRFITILAGLLFSLPAASHGGAVEGTVVDQDGQPVRGVLVSIDRTDGRGHYKVTTDAAGHFVHTGLPLGIYDIAPLGPHKRPLNQIKSVRINVGAIQNLGSLKVPAPANNRKIKSTATVASVRLADGTTLAITDPIFNAGCDSACASFSGHATELPSLVFYLLNSTPLRLDIVVLNFIVYQSSADGTIVETRTATIYNLPGNSTMRNVTTFTEYGKVIAIESIELTVASDRTVYHFKPGEAKRITSGGWSKGATLID